MDSESSSGSVNGIQLNVGLQFHKIIDYDRKAMRRALVKGAAEVRKAARRLVSRNAISTAGQYPGVETGTLKRAIGVISKGRKGGWIKVGVKKTPAMKDYYPAFLFYGSKKTGLAARANYITAALAEKRDTIRNNSRNELKNALVPR